MIRRIVQIAGPVLATALIAFIIVWHARIWWWVEVHTGTVNESGPYYGFFSGFGSDLGEYVIVWSVLYGVYRHVKLYNCHEPGCPRIGIHLANGGVYRYCTRHHPEHEQFGGQLPPREHRHALHWRHVGASPPAPPPDNLTDAA